MRKAFLKGHGKPNASFLPASMHALPSMFTTPSRFIQCFGGKPSSVVEIILLGAEEPETADKADVYAPQRLAYFFVWAALSAFRSVTTGSTPVPTQKERVQRREKQKRERKELLEDVVPDAFPTSLRGTSSLPEFSRI